MAEALRITADELKRRMESGESFTVIDTRNPQAWAESDVEAQGAMRVPLDKLDHYLSRIPRNKPIVTYCT
jgi:rhodanese-related sulfurtransferase